MLTVMKIYDCDDLDEIFTHVDEDAAQTVRHFNATKMRDFARTSQEVKRHNVVLEKDQVEFIRRNRGIEQPRLDRLIEPYLSQPIIFIEFEPGLHLTIDGHHRIVRNFDDGKETLLGYEFPYGLWQQFLVEDVNKVIETAAYDSGMAKEVI